MHKSILLAILPLAVFAAKEPRSWPVTGVVTEECAVAVSVKPMLYSAATQGREDALRSELRVRDSKGRDVPYAFRAAKTRVVDEVKDWRELKVTRVTETDGRLVVDAEFPAGSSNPERFLALKVATPLTDFEQSVEVSSEGVPLASGVLCDYRKFADLRVTEMPLEASYRRTLTVTFAKPTSEAAAAAFERTIRENGEGKLEAKSVRESVVNRPFRIDSLSVAVPRTRVRFEAAPPMEVLTACTVETDSKAKKTVLETSVFGLPMTAIAVNATDRNFSRKVAVATSRARSRSSAVWTRAGIRLRRGASAPSTCRARRRAILKSPSDAKCAKRRFASRSRTTTIRRSTLRLPWMAPPVFP